MTKDFVWKSLLFWTVLMIVACLLYFYSPLGLRN